MGKLVAALLYLALLVAAGYGWIANFVALVHLAQDGGNVSLMFILRIVGIFAAPLGAMLGYV